MRRSAEELKRSVLPPSPEGTVPAVQLLESDYAYTFVHWEYGGEVPEHLVGALKVPKGIGEMSVLGTALYPTDAKDFAGHEIPGRPLDQGELADWLKLIDQTLQESK